MLTPSQLEELRVNFAFWRAIQQCRGLAYPPKDDATFQLLAERAVKYGALDGARSSWNRAAFVLAKEGAIRLHEPEPQPPEIDQAFRDEIQRMPSSLLLKRLNTDPTFKAKFDAFAMEDTAERPREENYESFSAKDWRSLPPETAARLMSNPAFKARIDALAAVGEL